MAILNLTLYKTEKVEHATYCEHKPIACVSFRGRKMSAKLIKEWGFETLYYIKQKCHKSFYLGKSDSGTWGIYGECPLIPKNINYDKITVKIS